MKIFKHRNLMGCIFAIVMAVPLLSILCRSAYVVVNKNAYQSYSQNIERQNITLVNQEMPLYDITFNLSNDIQLSTNTYTFYVDNLTYNKGNLTTSLVETLESATYIRLWYNSNYSTNYLSWDNAGTNISANSYSVNITFDLLNVNATTDINYSIFDNYFYRGTSDNTLDNAFDYSLSKFVDDNSFGNLNFFQWFESLFLDMSNSSNALYIHFVNWYMNYALFVSCAYILFLVLMWFINFSRRLLERGMNYDW